MENYALTEKKSHELTDFGSIVAEIVQIGMEIDINSIETARQALNVVAQARSIIDQIESRKTEIAGDAKRFLDTLNASAKQMCDQLETLESVLDLKLNDFTFFNDIQKITTEQASCYQRIDYIFEVDDITKVPKELLMVDVKKVKALIKAGVDGIPGLTISQKKRMEIRRAS